MISSGKLCLLQTKLKNKLNIKVIFMTNYTYEKIEQS